MNEVQISKRPIYFHIGMPKCGSTFLQWKVFEPNPEIHHLFAPHLKKEIHDFYYDHFGRNQQQLKKRSLIFGEKIMKIVA
jgi:hypothetical protein